MKFLLTVFVTSVLSFAAALAAVYRGVDYLVDNAFRP